MDGARIAAVVRNRMRELGLSQADLVRASGVNATTVRELVYARRDEYRQGTLGRIERALDLKPAGYLERIGNGEEVVRPPEHLDLDGVVRQLDRLAAEMIDLRDQVERLRAAP